MTKKRKILIAVTLLLCIILIVVIIIRPPRDKIDAIFGRIENALGEEWEKESVTQVVDLQYADDAGNTIIYYLCVTTYYGADTDEVAGLNTDAICAVIDPETGESVRACTVKDFPAAIIRKDGRAYLCWTMSLEISCILEYDPTQCSEAEIFRMAESVPSEG